MMVRQMRFLDPSVHMRVRTLASRAFTPRRVEQLESHIQEIVDGLLDEAQERGGMDVIAELGRPLPSIVMAELLGVPVEDWPLLIRWAADFGSVLGNFQYNPDRVAAVRQSLDEMSAYFGDQVRRQAESPREGLVDAFARADAKGDRLTEEEIVANLILCMAGGLEAPTNLIGNGILTLLRNPDQLARYIRPRFTSRRGPRGPSGATSRCERLAASTASPTASMPPRVDEPRTVRTR